jgi:hypothetical protein
MQTFLGIVSSDQVRQNNKGDPNLTVDLDNEKMCRDSIPKFPQCGA